MQWTCSFLQWAGPLRTLLPPHGTQRPSRALPDERCPAGRGSTVLLHVFIHLTETFTFQISLKGNIQNLEAN